MLPHVPPESQPAAARTALLATPAITPDEDRADALLRLAEALPAARTVARPGA
ncbi:hypothetical protein [Dactylosporangium sp. NBC_01737]|uniref:hypothetical protein n=1 Tax=Dactylosporangium sp. NBC_01737 TaxID=2975959 RepID=UPI003FA34390